MTDKHWTIIDIAGRSAVEFTSFISIDYRNEGQALSYPVEQSGFTNYNKVGAPLDIAVTLAMQGDSASFEKALKTLDGYQKLPVMLDVCTPSAYYPKMTLESYSYKRQRDNGAELLVVELKMIEVQIRRTRANTTVKVRGRNRTSGFKKGQGKVQTQELASVIIDRITSASKKINSVLK